MPMTKNIIKIELDLPNYATKFDLKNAAGVDTSDVTKKADLASLRSEVDEVDVDKLEKYQAKQQ